MITFGERLKELRNSRNLTQKEVAQIFGMTERNYQKLETVTKPKYESIVKFADYYNVSTDYLLGRTDNKEINK